MHAQAPRPSNEKWLAGLGSTGYFFAAVLLHLLVFFLVATLVIWKAPVPPVDISEFHPVKVKVPPAPIQPPATGAAANNPQFEPPTVTVPVVTPPSTITTTASSTFTIDAAKDINQALTQASDRLATGSGAGPAGGGTGTGAGNSFSARPPKARLSALRAPSTISPAPRRARPPS